MILILWIRERIHEIGILLSIGVNRYKIIIQFIAELFYISIPSVILSVLFTLGILLMKKPKKILSKMS